MYLRRIHTEQFKRLKVIDIDLTYQPNLVQITGRNGSGKTSVIDAIIAALAGRKGVVPHPIRAGETEAIVELTFDGLKVVRRWFGDKTTLSVQALDGARYPSPQDVLNKLVGELSFDPMGFARADEKRQAEILRQLVGLDFTQADAEREKAYNDRTTVGRRVKKLEGEVDGMPYYPDAANGPNLADAMAEQKAARQADQRISKAAGDLRASRAHYESLGKRAADLKAELDRVAAELAQAQVWTIEKAAEHTEALKGAPDFDAIERRVQEALAGRDRLEANRARDARAAELSEEAMEHDRLEKLIRLIDKEKADKLAAASYPIPGLTLVDDVVRYQGFPLVSQCQSTRLVVSLAIASALQPELRVIPVKDTPMLDDTTLAALERWAEEADIQILLERATNAGDGVGIEIEEGCVVSVDGVEVP